MLKRSLAVLLIALFARDPDFADDHVRQPKLTSAEQQHHTRPHRSQPRERTRRLGL